MNNHGQSLVGGLVAATITLSTFLAIVEAMTYSGKAVRNVESHSGMTNLNDTINLILDNPATCQKAFWDSEVVNGVPKPQIAYFDPDKPPQADRLPATVMLGSSVVLSLGAQTGLLTTSALSFSELDPSVRAGCNGSTSYLAAMSIAATRSGALTSSQLTESYPFYVSTNDSTHQIVACGRQRTPCATPIPSPPPLPQPSAPYFAWSTSPTGNPIVTSYTFPAGPWLPFNKLYIVNIGGAPGHGVYSAFPRNQVIRANANCQNYTATWNPGIACTIQYQSAHKATQFLGVEWRETPNGPLIYNWIKLTTN